jgi:hypothetical protein
MPHYLPLGASRQDSLPDDCCMCAWWQTAGRSESRGPAAAERRREWAADLEPDWGHLGLLVQESAGLRPMGESAEPVVSASIHFAPASSLARFRELPFPPLPAFSAFLFCLHSDGELPRPLAKRLIRKSLHELRGRGVQEVYAIAHWPEGHDGGGDCRFFSSELLAETGFGHVGHNGHLCLMRADNRGLISLLDQVEVAIRHLFSHEPAPSPAAWAQERDGAEQGVP